MIEEGGKEENQQGEPVNAEAGDFPGVPLAHGRRQQYGHPRRRSNRPRQAGQGIEKFALLHLHGFAGLFFGSFGNFVEGSVGETSSIAVEPELRRFSRKNLFFSVPAVAAACSAATPDGW